MSLQEHSSIGDELRPWERKLVWDGICPLCRRESLMDAPRKPVNGVALTTDPMAIVCTASGCDFSCRVTPPPAVSKPKKPASPPTTGVPLFAIVKSGVGR